MVRWANQAVMASMSISLGAIMKRCWSACIIPSSHTLIDGEESLSVEDQRAKQIMDESVVLVNGHYQLKLPFRHSPPCSPDSLPRLYWLNKRMENDPEFHKQYASVIKKYQEEGSSRQVPDEEVSTLEHIWSYHIISMLFGTRRDQMSQ